MNHSEKTAGEISIDRAAKFAGVTTDTINQYAKLGLISSREERDIKFFKQEELERFFFISKDTKLKDKEDLKTSANNKSDNQKQNNQSSLDFSVINTEKENTQLNKLQLDKLAETSEPQKKDFFSDPIGATDSTNSDNILSLIHLNRSLREQLAELRNERDWLRTRLEKLEDRSEREQMLLLSSNTTVQKLITDKESPRRNLWAFLSRKQAL